MNNVDKIILIGYGGHAESMADSIQQSHQFEIVGYTDSSPAKKSSMYPYLGDDSKLQLYFDSGIRNVAICVGFLGASFLRDKLYNMVKKIGFYLPPIIDKTAILANNISIGEGSYIGKGVVINSKSKIGKMCIINTRAVVEHENLIGDFSHISVNSVLCGNVNIGNHVFIGANSTIIQEKEVSSNSIVGAGSIVLDDVPEKSKIYGTWTGKLEK